MRGAAEGDDVALVADAVQAVGRVVGNLAAAIRRRYSATSSSSGSSTCTCISTTSSGPPGVVGPGRYRCPRRDLRPDCPVRWNDTTPDRSISRERVRDPSPGARGVAVTGGPDPCADRDDGVLGRVRQPRPVTERLTTGSSCAPNRGTREARGTSVRHRYRGYLIRPPRRSDRPGPGPDRTDPDLPGRALILVENLSVPFDRRVWQEATTLRDHGWDVEVICPLGTDRDTEREATVDGVAIHRYPLQAASGGPQGYLKEYATALFHSIRLARSVHRRDRGRRGAPVQPAGPAVRRVRSCSRCSAAAGRRSCSTSTTSCPSSTLPLPPQARRAVLGPAARRVPDLPHRRRRHLDQRELPRQGGRPRPGARIRGLHGAQRTRARPLQAGAAGAGAVAVAGSTCWSTSASWARRTASTTPCAPWPGSAGAPRRLARRVPRRR